MYCLWQTETRAASDMATKTISNTAIDVSDIGDVAVLRKPDGGTVYLLGSCHVSDSSASEAGELVRRVRPSTVVLELCDGRRGLLFEPDEKKPMAATEQNASTLGTSLADVAGSMGNVLGDWTHLIKMQYSALDTLDTPAAGGEFRAAAREADAVGAAVVLGDRSVVTTTMRLKRLVPYSETILSFVLEDTEWAEKHAIERYSASEELKRTSGSLSAALKRPHSAAREAELQALSAQLSLQTARTFESAVPGFSDAVMSGLMRRFWKKELIGEPEKALLRRALNEMHRSDPLEGSSLPPTMRRILLSERDIVLCDALKRAPGERVVGVVGRAHVKGISKIWETDTSSELQSCLEVPRPSWKPLYCAAVGVVAIPYALYRSRAARIGLGGCVVAGVASTGYLTVALRDRIDFYQRSQHELAVQQSNVQ